MSIELRILSGARAGEVRSFDQPVLTVGRAPDRDLRFDAAADLDVSARHAEIRQTADGYEIVDAGSTNGTLVNGRPIQAAHALHTGDVITFGVNGPRASIRVRGESAARQSSIAADATPGAHAAHRVSIALREQTNWLWRLLGGAVVLLLVVAGVGYLVHRHETSVSQAELARLLAANRAASQEFQAKLEGTQDTLLASEVRRRNAALRSRARGDSGVPAAGEAEPPHGTAAVGIARELARSNAVQHALADMDLPAVRLANDSAIVLIAVELHGSVQQATGFCVSGGGVVVTNRHVVADGAGRASRIAVKFAHTREWRTAHVVRLSRDSAVDLALIQMDGVGPYPAVRGISPSGVDVPVGAPIAALGFPPPADTAESSAPDDAVARPTFSTGTINRSLIGLLQIDAFAGKGSSGSPVFDRHDHVIGVVWGGVSSAGHIVYAVPADRLLPLLPSALRDSIVHAGAR